MFTLLIEDYVLPTDCECIKYAFENQNYAHVKYVEFIPHCEDEYNTNKEMYGSAYVYINYWYNTNESQNLQNQLSNNPDGVEIVYDNTTSWMVREVPEDYTKLLSSINYTLQCLSNNTEYQRHRQDYNNYCMTYLLNVDRKNCMKQKREERTSKNYKKQKRWQKRLRPRNTKI